MRLRKLLTILLLNLLFTAVLVEITLQLAHRFGANSRNPLLQAMNAALQPPTTWQELFLRAYMENGTLVYAGIHQPHPTRGWSMKPSSSVTLPPDTHYTTNHQGYRALYDFSHKPGSYEVMIVGDSFTFGDQIDDQFTWPHLLQKKDSRMNVFNMAGSGYGTDQMLITLQEEIDHYHPDLVIAAFIADDLYRVTLPFRDYKKPQLQPTANGQLKTTNTPIGSLAEVINEIAAQPSFPHSSLEIINLWHRIHSTLIAVDSNPVCDTGCLQLNTAILEQMQKLSKTHHADFLAVYLPYGKEIRKTDARSYGEDFFDSYRKNHEGHFLNPRPQFLDATFTKAKGHYQPDENLLLSTLVVEKIMTLPSWRCTSGEQPSCL